MSIDGQLPDLVIRSRDGQLTAKGCPLGKVRVINDAMNDNVKVPDGAVGRYRRLAVIELAAWQKK